MGVPCINVKCDFLSVQNLLNHHLEVLLKDILPGDGNRDAVSDLWKPTARPRMGFGGGFSWGVEAGKGRGFGVLFFFLNQILELKRLQSELY